MFSKLVRLGKDAEVGTTPNGKQVTKIVAVYDVGWGDNKKSVWLDASWWGDRGTKLAQYLTKGTQIVLHADDVEPDYYDGKNGIVTKLKMNVVNVELVAKSQQSAPAAPVQQAQQTQAAPRQAPVQQAAPAGGGFGDFDDDIPF